MSSPAAPARADAQLTPGTTYVEAWIPMIGGRVHLPELTRDKSHAERVVHEADINGLAAEVRPCVLLIGAKDAFIPNVNGGGPMSSGRRIHTAKALKLQPSGQEIMDFLARHKAKKPPAWIRGSVVGDCWIWQGAKDRDGYGKMKYRGRDWRTNRWAAAVFNGEDIKGKEGHHECFTPGCNNPDHLTSMKKTLNAAIKPPKPKKRASRLAGVAA